MKRHEVDVFSLVFGLIFLAVTAAWLVAKTVEVTWLSMAWIAVGALVAVGLTGLLTAWRPSRHK